MILDQLLFSGLAGALILGGYFTYLQHTASEDYKKAHPWKFDFIIVNLIVSPLVGGGLGALAYYIFYLLTS